MNRRRQIALTPEERREYVSTASTVVLTSHDRHGYPHSVPMWFVVDPDETVWMTTYRKAQKTLNIRRNANVALLVESGITYDTLKGVLIRGQAEVIDDPETVVGVIKRVHEKMSAALAGGGDEAILAQARKRIAIKVVPRHVSSWDHAKLGASA
jgi:PPOX class probable F420-dependent enzyme